LIVALRGNPEIRVGIRKGRADARPFLIVYSQRYQNIGRNA